MPARIVVGAVLALRDGIAGIGIKRLVAERPLADAGSRLDHSPFTMRLGRFRGRDRHPGQVAIVMAVGLVLAVIVPTINRVALVGHQHAAAHGGVHLEARRNIRRRTDRRTLGRIVAAVAIGVGAAIDVALDLVEGRDIEGVIVIGPLLGAVGAGHHGKLADRLGIVRRLHRRPFGQAALALVEVRQTEVRRIGAHIAAGLGRDLVLAGGLVLGIASIAVAQRCLRPFIDRMAVGIGENGAFELSRHHLETRRHRDLSPGLGADAGLVGGLGGMMAPQGNAERHKSAGQFERRSHTRISPISLLVWLDWVPQFSTSTPRVFIMV